MQNRWCQVKGLFANNLLLTSFQRKEDNFLFWCINFFLFLIDTFDLEHTSQVEELVCVVFKMLRCLRTILTRVLLERFRVQEVSAPRVRLPRHLKWSERKRSTYYAHACIKSFYASCCLGFTYSSREIGFLGYVRGGNPGFLHVV